MDSRGLEGRGAGIFLHEVDQDCGAYALERGDIICEIAEETGSGAAAERTREHPAKPVGALECARCVGSGQAQAFERRAFARVLRRVEHERRRVLVRVWAVGVVVVGCVSLDDGRGIVGPGCRAMRWGGALIVGG
jgi:hypothetical protein